MRHGTVGYFAVLSSHPISDEITFLVVCRCGSALATNVTELSIASQRAKTAPHFTRPGAYPLPHSKKGAVLLVFEQVGGFAYAHHMRV